MRLQDTLQAVLTQVWACADSYYESGRHRKTAEAEWTVRRLVL